ncbi:MAG: glycosyl transferase family 1, partial [Planctomycetota bacterium]
EAKGLVQACLAAGLATGEKFWVDEAVRCFEWFRGENDLEVQMYDEETGGCHDGLCPEGAAPNEGAESTLAYVLSVLDLHHYHRIQRTSERISVIPTRVRLSV